MNTIMFYSGLPFPNIDPVIFSIGPIKLHWYGLGYVVGILFSWWYGKCLLRTFALWQNSITPINLEKLDDFVIWAAIGVIFGGRFGEVFFYGSDYYFAHVSQIIAVWDGGMSFHGGFIGTTLAMILFALKNKISVWSMFDTIAAGVPVGLGVVRICNFINSELWGRVTNVPWAVYFPNGGNDIAGNLLARHPSQLYEAILEGPMLFLILAFLIFRLKALRKPGLVAGSFTLIYGLVRFFSEFFREPSISYVMGKWLTMGMALSLPMIILGLGIIFWVVNRSKQKI
ncbi:MAG: phosphatidylglycerol:prolipoprotein diacylglycerol transferase [Candidatus Tokpelaia sp. JSC188]|nr:MAG: phosphatidylglycerol:prolipoprotein diacylglycerol transferase [Candidatus Tokpelaia sp. JSC188]